jgi:hypothetical protein
MVLKGQTAASKGLKGFWPCSADYNHACYAADLKGFWSTSAAHVIRAVKTAEMHSILYVSNKHAAYLLVLLRGFEDHEIRASAIKGFLAAGPFLFCFGTNNEVVIFENSVVRTV